jgi:hypothetical protein
MSLEMKEFAGWDLKNLEPNPLGQGHVETDLTCHSNHIEHPSRNSVLCAVRKVAHYAALTPCTCRTLPHHGNTGFRYSGIQELAPVGFPKIQANLSGISRADKKFLRVAKLPSKLRPQLLSDRITAWSDTWPNGCRQVHGLRAILLLHDGNATLHNLRDSSPPSSVKRCHDSLRDVDHEDRDAICRPHSQQNSGHVSDKPISLQYCLSLSGLKPSFQRSVLLFHHSHNVGVNLPHPDEHRTGTFAPYGSQESPSILGYRSRIIFFCPPEIQGGSPVNLRDPTTARTEPVEQPLVLLPSLNLQHMQVVFPADLFVLDDQVVSFPFFAAINIAPIDPIQFENCASKIRIASSGGDSGVSFASFALINPSACASGRCTARPRSLPVLSD